MGNHARFRKPIISQARQHAVPKSQPTPRHRPQPNITLYQTNPSPTPPTPLPTPPKPVPSAGKSAKPASPDAESNSMPTKTPKSRPQGTPLHHPCAQNPPAVAPIAPRTGHVHTQWGIIFSVPSLRAIALLLLTAALSFSQDPFAKNCTGCHGSCAQAESRNELPFDKYGDMVGESMCDNIGRVVREQLTAQNLSDRAASPRIGSARPIGFSR